MEKYKFQSKSESDLLQKALDELNLKEEDVLTKLSEEKSGLFSGKKYTLEVVKLSDVAKLGKEILKELLISLGIDANIETKIRDGQIKYEIFSKNNSLLIGKQGHVLNSLQIYIRQAIYNAIDLFVNVSVDVERYKEKQLYFLEKKVKKIARDVTLTKMPVKLDPMDAYTRRIVHTALQGFKYITTESEGEEPNRYIVVKYTESKDKKEKNEEKVEEK